MTRILLVYDVEGWAWHRRCLALQKYAPADCEVEILSQNDYRPGMEGKVDAMLWFSWAWPPNAKRFDKVWSFVASESLLHRHDVESDDLRSRLCSAHTDSVAAGRIIPKYHGMITVNKRCIDTDQCTGIYSGNLHCGILLTMITNHRNK